MPVEFFSPDSCKTSDTVLAGFATRRVLCGCHSHNGPGYQGRRQCCSAWRDGVLLKPLPWFAIGSIACALLKPGRVAPGRVLGTVSNGTFLAWRDHPSTIDDIGGWRTQTATLSGAGDPIRVSIVPMTPSLFPTLKVHPFLGRLFRSTARVCAAGQTWRDSFV